MPTRNTICGLVLVLLSAVAALPALAEEGATAPDAAIVQRAEVSLGDLARLDGVLAKARRGEAVTIGVIGGSITQGASASAEANRYGNRVAQWWRDTFPAAAVEFVNAGIGATGSDLAAHRVQQHLLAKHPDFVVVEFGVNDPNTPAVAETLEGLVRQILAAPNHPAVMLLFMMNNTGANAQEQHEIIGRHYGLPMASFRDALWPEIQAGRMAWADVEADEVHPNDRGHEYAARFVANILQKALDALPPDAQLPAIPAIPTPKISDTFEHTALHTAKSIAPVRNDGWAEFDEPGASALFGPGWKSDTPGSTIEFDVEGTAVSILFYRVKGATGIAEAQVDDAPPVRMDAWFSATWGGYTPVECVARDLKPGKHRLRITLLEEKNPESTGHEFRIHAIMTGQRSGA